MNKKSKKKNKKEYKYKYFSAAVVMFFIFLTVFSAGALKKLKTHYSFKQFQPKNHELLLNDQKIRKIFNISIAPYTVLIESENRSWMNEEGLNGLLALEDRLQGETKGIVKVVSLASVNTAVATEEVFSTGSLHDMYNFKRDKDWYKKDKLISPNFISEDGLSTAIYIVPEELGVDEHNTLIQQIRSIVEDQFSNSKVYIGGAPAIRAQMTLLLSKEIRLFVALALFMALVILMVVFKDLVTLLMSGIIIIVANMFSLGLMAYMNIPFTVLSSTLPILVTISVVAITTHTFVRLDEIIGDQVSFEEKMRCIKATYMELVKPHCLTALTTAVGFGSLMFSEVPLIRQYGTSVAIGVMLSCFCSLAMLPSLLILFRVPRTRSWFYTSQPFFSNLLRYKKVIALSFLFGIVGLSYLGTQLSWSARLFTDLPSQHSARVSTERISKDFGGAVPLDISLKASSAQFWKEPKNLKSLEALMEKWRHLEGVGSAISVSTFIKASQPSYELPQTDRSISEIYLLYGMAQENPLRDYIAPKGDQIRVALRLQDMPADELMNLKSKMREQVVRFLPGVKINMAGMASTVHELGIEVSKNLMFGFYTALFWIFILLGISFRSFVWAAISIIPNLVPPSLLLAGLAITKTPIKPGIALIFAISLGMAFDNTVYILGRLKEMLEQYKDDSFEEILSRLISSESKPCLVSSVSLMAGFSIFIFSYFEVNMIFGAFMILALLAGLLGDLVFLPAVLYYLRGLLIQKENFESLELASFPRREIVMNKYSLLVAFVLPVVFFSKNLESKTLSAKEVLQKVEASSALPFEQSDMTMVIYEPDGSKKERSLSLKRMHKGGEKALVKISSPADLKGVGFLSVHSGASEDQWLYLPSTKRARRIVGSGSNSRFLDSDLTYDDFKTSTYKDFKNRILKDEDAKKVVVIESLAKTKNSAYAKILTWISLKDFKVLKSNYFDSKGQLIKTMSFKKYKKYKNKYWRAHLVEVKDIKLKRKTLLTLSSVKMKKTNENEFSLTELEQ
ncbi:MAG: outer membrane lipoprotein-sorting protein [Bdellovibrionales bacterium]|nr:outer membrane lipoprotein-sorting protein [Bdellovibrionales bacterium]